MRTENIFLKDNNKKVHITSYLLDNSEEMDIDKKRPAVIICPGGAYMMTSDREAEPVAMNFLAKGYQAFVLRYSTGSGRKTAYPDCLYELAATMVQVRKNADEWNVDVDKIVVCGFSAGAHLAALLSVYWHEKFLSDAAGVPSDILKPNAVILGYPITDYIVMREKMIRDKDEELLQFFERSNRAFVGKVEAGEEELLFFSPARHVSQLTPPTFMWHTAEDKLVYAENSLVYGLALSKHKVPYELHIFESGPHGLSLANEITAKKDANHINEEAAQWFPMAMKWLDKRMNLLIMSKS